MKLELSGECAVCWGRSGVLLPASLGTSKSQVLSARKGAQALVAHAANLFRVAGLCLDRPSVGCRYNFGTIEREKRYVLCSLSDTR